MHAFMLGRVGTKCFWFKIKNYFTAITNSIDYLRSYTVLLRRVLVEFVDVDT